ncbi:cupin [Pseudomonas sp. R84]|uniref:cupin domain-containing protein n=1 Tax=Pseudomonas sp. R84 TaxID=1573712 RepID=UPI00131FBCDD|nr:cupin domain-containing protein [Pseudomonas sp. R84]QHC95662.1 cupin [Pseudomonas sp. R84]
MHRPLFLATAAIFASMIGFAYAADAQPKSWQHGLSRTDLVREDLGAAEREVIQARVDFEPGVTSPRHAHPGVEVAYVISGTFEYQLEGRAPVTLKAGDSLFIPEGVAHIARNVGKDKGSELATYIVKKGEPVLILKP